MNKLPLLRHFYILIAGVTPLVVSQMNAAPTAAKPQVVKASVVQSNVVYRSVFIVPTDPKQGRDPFFPESQRFQSASSTNNVQPAPAGSTAALLLQGISGTSERRLAIVNGHTLAEGEETEVSVNGARLRFRCLEIKTDSVVIEIGTERRELRLRAGY